VQDSDVKPASQNLLTDCRELRAILAKSCATARRPQKRRKKPDS